MIVNITTTSGVDFRRSFQYKDVALVAISLLNCQLGMMVRHVPPDATAALHLSTINGKIVITNPAAGMFELFMPVADLNALPAGMYHHSLVVIKSDLTRDEIWHGTLTHSIGVTR